MSEPDNFLARWSRRKRDVAKEEKASADQMAPQPKSGQPDETAEPIAGRETAPLDLDKLPPLDSIAAETDVAQFLRPGVPADLTHAALRRAWAADPNIRDFVGLQENDWEFNPPGAAEGFGPLGPEHDVGKLLAQVFGEKPQDEPAAPTSEQSQQVALETPGTTANEIPAGEESSRDADKIVHRNTVEEPAEEGESQSGKKRTHGGALARPLPET
jgi:hypothetical protein